MNVVAVENAELANVEYMVRVDEEDCLPSGAVTGTGHCVLKYIFHGRDHV